MVSSSAKTVDEYISSLPDAKRREISSIRKLILKNLPKGYKESMQYGMISYCVPLEEYPDTYNGQPLVIAALAAQKNYNSLYLMAVYGNPEIEKWFKDKYKASGKKLDMGKSCVCISNERMTCRWILLLKPLPRYRKRPTWNMWTRCGALLGKQVGVS